MAKLLAYFLKLRYEHVYGNNFIDTKLLINILISTSKRRVEHTTYELHLDDVYLELNVFPDRESNQGPFNLEPTVLTIIPLCFG